MSHVAHSVDESCLWSHVWVMYDSLTESRILTIRHVAHSTNESCRTHYEWVMSYPWIHVMTHINAFMSYHVWVISKKTSFFLHGNKSCHMNDFMSCHIWMISRHVTYGWFQYEFIHVMNFLWNHSSVTWHEFIHAFFLTHMNDFVSWHIWMISYHVTYEWFQKEWFRMSHVTPTMCVTCAPLVHIYDTHCVCDESFVCVTWLIHKCDICKTWVTCCHVTHM